LPDNWHDATFVVRKSARITTKLKEGAAVRGAEGPDHAKIYGCDVRIGRRTSPKQNKVKATA